VTGWVGEYCSHDFEYLCIATSSTIACRTRQGDRRDKAKQSKPECPLSFGEEAARYGCYIHRYAYHVAQSATRQSIEAQGLCGPAEREQLV
jgi:hypothetical protein